MICDKEKNAFETKLSEVQRKYENEVKQISDETESDLKDLSDEFENSQDLGEGVGAVAGTVIGGAFGPAGAAIGGTIGREIGKFFIVKINEEEVKAILDVPGIEMSEKEWFVDMPEVTIKDSDIIFHAPALVMKTVRGPDIPEFKTVMKTECVGSGIFRVCADVPQTTRTWKKTYYDKPTWEMREQRIVLGIPEITMKTQRMVVSVPEIKNYRQEFSFTLPVISIEFVTDASKDMSDKAKDISNETEKRLQSKKLGFKERVKSEIVGPATTMFDCYKDSIMKSKSSVADNYDPQIQIMVNSLNNLKANKVPEDDNDYIALKSTLDEMIASRDKQLAKFDEAIAKLDEACKKTIDNLINS